MLAVIIPELVLPNQQVASVRVSPWLEPLPVTAGQESRAKALGLLSIAPSQCFITGKEIYGLYRIKKKNRMEMNNCQLIWLNFIHC